MRVRLYVLAYGERGAIGFYLGLEFSQLQEDRDNTARTEFRDVSDSFVCKRLSLPVRVLLFTIPARVGFCLTTCRVSFQRLKRRQATWADGALSILGSIGVVGATASLRVRVGTTAISPCSVTQRHVVRAGVCVSFVANNATCVAILRNVPSFVATR